jgi:hypothetical protein
LDLGIVIPVWQGAALLPRSLEGLLGQDDLPGTVTVVIVVNDVEPRAHLAARQVAESYAGRMAERGYAYHVLSCPPGRRTAFAAGEAILPVGARVYLDQDAMLSGGALARLAPLICRTGRATFATLSLRFTTSRSGIVRRVLQTLCALPYVIASPVTAGCYAVSAEGRALWDWDKMPASVGDDKFVRRLFPPSERHLVREESYEVVAPDSYRALLAARTRYARMNQALKNVTGLFPDTGRGAGVLRHLQRPEHWLGAVLTAWTLGHAYLGARCRPR